MPTLRAAFDVECSSIMPQGTIDLLESTQFGSDGLRYRRLGVAGQLSRFNAPVYFYIHQAGELIGVYVLDKRALDMQGHKAFGYYRASLAVSQPWQGSGAGKALAKYALQWIDSPGAGDTTFSYGCIDDSNKRSLSVLASQGAQPVSQLCMVMMYRQWHRSPVEIIVQENNDDWLDNKNVRSSYGEYAVRDISKSSIPCFTLKDNEGTMISARAVPTEFQIATMGALATWLTRLFVTPWPPAKARFNPQRFRYVSFSQVLVRPGCESSWKDFVSSVLAHYQCHFGTLYLDPSTQLFSTLRSVQGLSRHFYKPQPGISIVSSGSLDGAETLTGQPVILWPVDA